MPQLLKAPLALALSTSLALPGVAMAAPPPASPAGDPAAMSDEEKMEVAKGLYGEGVAALDAGDAASALQKFESAYNEYAPTLHVFNYNIGQAAYELGDCVKAKTSFQRFLDLVSDHDLRGDATEKILEIERSGCANTTAVAPVTTPTPTTTTTPAPTTTTGPSELDNEDAPELTSRRDEREDQIEAEVEEAQSKKASPLLISGAALTAVGGLSLIGGAVSLGLANKKANDLANLASPGTTGFPDGNYSDDEVFNLDRNALPANNAATIALFIGGGVFTAVGVSLLIVDAKKKKGKKPGDKNAKASDGKSASRSGPRLVGLGAGPMRGGAAASAAVRF